MGKTVSVLLRLHCWPRYCSCVAGHVVVIVVVGLSVFESNLDKNNYRMLDLANLLLSLYAFL